MIHSRIRRWKRHKYGDRRGRSPAGDGYPEGVDCPAAVSSNLTRSIPYHSVLNLFANNFSNPLIELLRLNARIVERLEVVQRPVDAIVVGLGVEVQV